VHVPLPLFYYDEPGNEEYHGRLLPLEVTVCDYLEVPPVAFHPFQIQIQMEMEMQVGMQDHAALEGPSYSYS